MDISVKKWAAIKPYRERQRYTNLFASQRGDSDNNLFLQVMTFWIRQGQILYLQLKLHPLQCQIKESEGLLIFE